MDAVHLAEAKVRSSELVDRVEARNSIEITCRGKPVARLASAAGPCKRIDAARLRALSRKMPKSESSVRLVRSMRDGDRYRCRTSIRG